MQGRGGWKLGCLAGVVLAARAWGQDGAIPPPKEAWSLQFEPSLWYGAAGGKLQMPGSSAAVPPLKLEQLNLDSPRLSPGGELHLYSDKWTFTLGGYHLGQDDRSTVAPVGGQMGPIVFAAGETLTASMRFTEVEAAVMRRLELPDTLSGRTDKDFSARLDVLGGMRFYDVSFDFSAPAGSTSADKFFAHPLIGVKLTMDIIEQFTIDAQVDLGAMASSGDSVAYGYDIMAGFMWRPTSHVGVQIGYRDLAYLLRSGAEGDRFEFRGAIQGLYFGAVIRF